MHAAWAIDFAEAPAPVDCYPYLLAVRDLASGQQLVWLPIEEATAEAANAALTMLFTIHGPPLVLKCDNGSPFLSASMRELLQTWKVLALFSPPGLPSYNGSCEAGIGSMKTRTHHHATRHGRPEQWTSDDVEAARLEANTTGAPLGSARANARESLEPAPARDDDGARGVRKDR